MLEVYFGNDTDAVRKAVQVRSASLKQASIEMSSIDIDNYTPGILADAVGANSLFGVELGFVLDTPSDEEVFNEEVMNHLAEMAESNHVFLIIEGVLLAPAKKKFAKHATTVEEFKKAASERFSTFSLADALANKNKKQLWMLLQEARLAGESAESIIGILWWQLKALRLALQTSTPEEAGMKAFPYNKAKRSLPKFKDGELNQLSITLLGVYHDGHAGLVEIDDALEAWVLHL